MAVVRPYLFMSAMFRVAIALLIAICVSFILFGNFIVRGQRPEPPVQPNQDIKPIAAGAVKPALRTQRFREGTLFKDKYVSFRQTGAQTVLYTVEDNQRFVCLENLALERILNTMRDKPEREFWKIEGEYTEFRGENRVLIRRAVIAKAPTVVGPMTP